MLRCPIMAGLFFHAIICVVVGLIVAGCSSGSKSVASASGPAERSAVERPPRPATLEDVRKTQETQTQEVGRLTGEVNDATKERFLADAAALLFPVDWPEPFGLVMIEAMACGTPVVASNRGAIPEVAGPAAVLVDAEDDAAMASAVADILTSPLKRRRLR